jgi:hypothetical protein
MKWEYQIIRAATVEEFESLLNKRGGEGWEATSAGEVGHDGTPATGGSAIELSATDAWAKSRCR